MTAYPGPHGRKLAAQLNAVDAKKLLQATLPYLLNVLTLEQIGQVQKVLDAAVVNPYVQKQYREAARKGGGVAGVPRNYYSDGAMSRPAESPEMRKISHELIDFSEADKHIRLPYEKLLGHDALRSQTDNKDEETYLAKVRRTLGIKGVYLRIEPKLVHDPEDRSRWIVGDHDFDVWLSLGYGGETIPTTTGQLTREAILNTSSIGAGFYVEVVKGHIQSEFDRSAEQLSRLLQDQMEIHETAGGARLTAAPGVVGIVDVLGGANFPSPKIWDLPWKLLMDARDASNAGHLAEASKLLLLSSSVAVPARKCLEQYLADIDKGVHRAVKTIVVITVIVETSLTIYMGATLISGLLAEEAAAGAVVRTTARRLVRKEIDEAAFGRLLETGKSAANASRIGGGARLDAWMNDVNRIWEAAQKRGMQLSDSEIKNLFKASSSKWGI